MQVHKKLLSVASAFFVLAMAVFIPIQIVDAAPSSTTMYVDFSAYRLDGWGRKVERDYQYTSGSTPNSSWGTSSKPYSDINSAIEHAFADGYGAVNIKLCINTITAGHGHQFIDPNVPGTMEVALEPGCVVSSIYKPQLIDPHNVVDKLTISGFDFSAIHPTWTFNNLRSDLVIEGNIFDNTTIEVINSVNPVNLSVEGNIFNNTGGYTPSPAVYLDNVSGNVSIENNTTNDSLLLRAVNNSVVDSLDDNIVNATSGAAAVELEFTDLGTFDRNAFAVNGDAFSLKDGSLGQSMDNTFTWMTSTMGGTAYSFDRAVIGTMSRNEVMAMERGISLSDNSSVDVISDSRFINVIDEGIGLSSSYVNQILNNEFEIYSGYLGSVTGLPGSSFTAGISVGFDARVDNALFNEFFQYPVGWAVTLDGSVGEISNDVFTDVDHSIYVYKRTGSSSNTPGHIENIVNVTITGGVDGISAVDEGHIEYIANATISGTSSNAIEVNGGRLDQLIGSELSEADRLVYVHQGQVGIIHHNDFLNFENEAIVFEGQEDAFDFYEAVVDAVSGPKDLSGYQTDINDNDFINDEIKDAVAIGAATQVDLGTIHLNRFETVERFAVFYDEVSFNEMTENQVLPSPVYSFSPTEAAIQMTEVTSGLLRDNILYDNSTGLSAAIFPVSIYIEGSEVEIRDHQFVSSDADVEVTLYKTFDSILADNIFSGSNVGLRVDGLSGTPGGADLTVESNVFENATLCALVDSTLNVQAVEFTGNEFTTCSTGIEFMNTSNGFNQVLENVFTGLTNAVILDNANVPEINGNVFDSVSSGILAKNASNTYDIIGNTFSDVLFPVEINSSSEMSNLMGNTIDGADVAIKLNNAVLDSPYFVGNLIVNSINAVFDTSSVSVPIGVVYVYHNSFDNNPSDIEFDGMDPLSFVYIKNNIFSETGSAPNIYLASSPLDADISYNLFRGIDTASTSLVLDSTTTNYSFDDLEAYCATSGSCAYYHQENEYDWVSGQTTYVDSSAGNYEINLDSYAVDNGEDLTATVSQDITGASRLSGGAPDMGAFEMTQTADSDGDGLWDEAEMAWGTDSADTDSDNDSDSDGDEVLTLHQDPSVSDRSDTDGDGMFDDYEDDYGLDKNDASDKYGDADNDGASNYTEFQVYADHGLAVYPDNDDSDSDGLDEAWEIQYAFSYDNWGDGTDIGKGCGIAYIDPSANDATDNNDGDNLTNEEEYDAGSSPCDDDSDDDQLLDHEEVSAGTDPMDEDTDADGLTDYEEVTTYASTYTCETGYSLSALDEDSDDDGLLDGEEVNHATYTLNPCDSDSDADDADDGDEIDAGTYPDDSDSDNDGLRDGYELDSAYYSADFNYYTVAELDPLDSDSDGDGYLDGQEIGEGPAGYEYVYDHTATVTYTTDPTSLDSDDDGWDDDEEVNGTYSGYTSTGYYSDPTTANSDNDGLTDYEEIVTTGTYTYTTDPESDDTDNDGLDDDEEYTVGTDPTNENTDGDLMLDGVTPIKDGDDACPTEAAATGYDADEDGCTDDSDGDGVGDDVDLCPSTPTGSSVDADGCADSDGDQLSDTLEATIGTDPNDTDTDDDGLSDYDEYYWSTVYATESASWTFTDASGLDPLDEDVDDDGLLDGEEVDGFTFDGSTITTDPTDADSDNDTLDDGDEVDGNNTAGYISDPNDEDSDDDGLWDDAELEDYDWITDPMDADTDDDDLDDYEELVTYGDAAAQGWSQTDADELDPTDSDTDGDGLSDGEEVDTYSTDPTDTNSDDDGLSDYEELVVYATASDWGWAGTYPLDPNNEDSDGDTLKDGAELNTHGTDPTNPDSDNDDLDDDEEINTYSTDPNDDDSDDDGLIDGDEVNTYGTDANDEDSDDDGLTDYEEVVTYATASDWGWAGTYALDPNDDDSDGDGELDGDEVDAGTDPTDPTSYSTDDDGDGVDNSLDLCVSTSAESIAAAVVDSDGCADYDEDGLTDTEETDTYGTDHTDNDTDGDKFTDGYGEVDQGTDPNTSSDYPDLEVTFVGYETMEGFGSGSSGGSVTWNDYTSSPVAYTSDSTHSMGKSERLYLLVNSSAERVFGVQVDEDVYLGSPTVWGCGGSSAAFQPSSGTSCSLSGVTQQTSSSGWSPWSSLGGTYTFGDWEWFDAGSRSTEPYYLFYLTY